MKLRHTAFLGLIAGIVALVAFPTTGQVFSPVPVDSLQSYDNGLSAITIIEGLPNSVDGADADEDCDEGIGHWVNTWRACMNERFKVHGPRTYCTKMTIGGRSYHIKEYIPEQRLFIVCRTNEDPDGDITNPT